MATCTNGKIWDRFRVYPKEIWKDFRVCIATGNVERILPLMKAVQVEYLADKIAFYRIMINFVHEAVEARAASAVKVLLGDQENESTWDLTTRTFSWVKIFERVCDDEDDEAALFMFDFSPFAGWAGMPVADKIKEFRKSIPATCIDRPRYIDFYSSLLHLHNKIRNAKKALERTRLRGLFRRWALNEQLLAPAYKPPTAEAAGGTAFQRCSFWCERAQGSEWLNRCKLHEQGGVSSGP